MGTFTVVDKSEFDAGGTTLSLLCVTNCLRKFSEATYKTINA